MNHRITAIGAIALLAAAGCGSDSPDSTSATGTSDPTAGVTFVLSDFAIGIDGTIPSGTTTLTIDNQGREIHELVLVAAADADALPRNADGSIDEEQIPEADMMGERADIAAGSTVTATFTLPPGAYVAFCNLVEDMGMSGNPGSTRMDMPASGGGAHVHFALGMYMPFVVD